MNLVYGLALHKFAVTQRTECPPGVWEVIASNPVGTQIFSFSHARDVLIISFSQAENNRNLVRQGTKVIVWRPENSRRKSD